VVVHEEDAMRDHEFDDGYEDFVQRTDERGTNIDSGRMALRQRLRRNTSTSPLLAGGDIDALWEMAESSGEETAGGSSSTPDQNVVEELGDAIGIGYQIDEELHCGVKEQERDLHRWELDPASSEDYRERARAASRHSRRASPFVHA
jgi:hypothetical protein